ncbi:unnamed protein product [Calicophoron daubneyi]|uniref:Ribosomal protein S6 kinase n=1 Tax=Calicophoron daubneyi TaxID=300641 RepID=A0AAV2TP33_CALDB
MTKDYSQPITNVEVQELSCFSQKIEPSHFQLLHVLGQGSFGKVFLVRKRVGVDAGTLFAMKVLRKASLKLRDRIRTKMERDILAAIHHPFIVRLEYAFQTEGKLYLILEYLRGGDLFSRLSKEVMLQEDDVRFYLSELILALNHLHQLGIIYRDLKPENILLDTDGHIKLTDFGLSKEAIHSESGGQAYSFCGTIEYMAPEVITRRGHDYSADWWSLGVLMFEMLCGMLPFQGEHRRDTMNQILRAKLRMPQFLSPDAQTLLRALFKRNPTNRLGYGPDALDQFKMQPFFSSIVWERLLDRTYPAPYRPVCSPPTEKATLDSADVSPSVKDSPEAPTSASAAEVFRGFSYIAPTVVEQQWQPADRKPPASTTMTTHIDKSSIPPSPLSTHSSGRIHADELDATHSNRISEASSHVSHTTVFGNGQKTHKHGGPLTAYLSEIGDVKATSFFDDYELKEAIGQGSYSICRRCIHRRTFQVYAVKIIDKRLRDPTEEIVILNQLRTLDNVVSLLSVYDSENYAYLVMEYLGGGELLDRILRKKCLSEYEASAITEVLARAIAEVHKMGIVHRDLKPSNILFSELDQTPQSLRICDFGFAKRFESSAEPLMTPCYTSLYAAPEVLRMRGYTSACDIWSLGVMLCIMLVGRAPYEQRLSDSPSAILKRIEQNDFHLTGSRWDKISSSAKSSVDVLFSSRPGQPSSVPILEPVGASQLAVRRQQSRLKSQEKTVTLHPHPKNPVLSPPLTHTSSSFVLRDPSSFQALSSSTHQLTVALETGEMRAQTAPGSSFMTSATFTLASPVVQKPFYSPGHDSMASRHRVVA